jgi:hypothetical protein
MSNLNVSGFIMDMPCLQTRRPQILADSLQAGNVNDILGLCPSLLLTQAVSSGHVPIVVDIVAYSTRHDNCFHSIKRYSIHKSFV